MIENSPLRSGTFVALVSVCVFAAYWVSLTYFFPKFFAPLEPANRDVIDHYVIGSLPWDTLLNAATRPTAWIAMKFVHPLGLSGLSLVGITAVLGSIGLIVVVFTARAGLSPQSALVGLPIYVLAMFTHPEFYIKHRDDLELAVAFFFLSLALFMWHRWRYNGSPLWLIGFCFCALIAPLAKETFFIAMPVLFLGLGLTEATIAGRYGAAAFCFGATAIDYIYLHSRNSFLDNGLSVYSQDLSLSSVLQLLARFLETALIWPTFALLLLSIALAISDRRRLIVALSFLIAGICAYLPNSFLPNHWIEWYGWDGLPLLLAPLLGVTTIPSRKYLWIVPGAYVLLIMTFAGYSPRYVGFPSRLVSEELIDQHILDSVPYLKKTSEHAIFLVRGIDDFQFLPWQTAGFTQLAMGEGMRFEFKAAPAVIAPIRKAGGVPFENSSLALADDAFIVAHPPDFVADYRSDGRLVSISKFQLKHRYRRSKDAERNAVSFFVDGVDTNVDVPPTLQWDAPNASAVEIHVNTPDGPLLTGAGSVGKVKTGPWVRPGMQFYLVDATLKDPRTSPMVIASLKVPSAPHASASPMASSVVVRQDGASLTIDPIASVNANGLGITTVHWKTTLPEIRIRVESSNGPLFVDQNGTGDAKTGLWAREGMLFYLQKPADSKKNKWLTIGSAAAHVAR